MKKAKNNKGIFTGLFFGGSFVYALITVLILIIILLFMWILKGSKVETVEKKTIGVTPAMITSMKKIGQWEFLSVSDEELVDTVRYGFFRDDYLVRIYYGTLRLGIDMKDIDSKNVKMDKDTVVVVLPRIKLLDDNFIDEGRTKAFYSQGEWKSSDYAVLYEKAKAQMKRRCINKENLQRAENNATKQFFQFFSSMGFDYVRITSSPNSH